MCRGILGDGHLSDLGLMDHWKSDRGMGLFQLAIIFFFHVHCLTSAGLFSRASPLHDWRIFFFRGRRGVGDNCREKCSADAILILIFATVWTGIKFKQILFFNFHTDVLLSCLNYTRGHITQYQTYSSAIYCLKWGCIAFLVWWLGKYQWICWFITLAIKCRLS